MSWSISGFIMAYTFSLRNTSGRPIQSGQTPLPVIPPGVNPVQRTA